MKYFLFIILFLGTAQASHEKGSECYELRYDADSACNGFEVECTNLGACQIRRNSCPMDNTSKQGCEAYNECMDDVESIKSKRPEDIARIKLKKPCIYHWETYKGGFCRLYNTGFEFITFPTCPGRRIQGKNNDDVNHDCRAHKVLLEKNQKECFEKKANYDKLCSSVAGYEKIKVEYQNCRFTDEKLFPADVDHKGPKGVNDQGRGNQKIIPPFDEGSGNGDDGKSIGK